MNAPSRPALRYHGGKWRIAPWIIGFFPPHTTYVEPFGGAASVLIRKPRSYAEVYNDLDDEVVNLFRVLRDPDLGEQLRRGLALTPFARVEFEAAYEAAADSVERARRLVVRSFMGHGSSGVRVHRTGFRANVYRQHTTPADDWASLPEALGATIDRLRGIVIEHRPAAEVIARYDRRDTLFYVDPPYLFATRSQKRIGSDLYHGYRHELDDDGHLQLLEQLASVQGRVVLSGYPSDVYEARLQGWERHERQALADSASHRTEVVWINPAASAALRATVTPLFARGSGA